MYLVGVSPVAGDNSYDATEGTVSYTLDGHMDLMYAGPLAGNKWDGNRFTGNTVAGVEANRSLNYAHLLTQLVFKAKKHDAGGLEVKVNKIIREKHTYGGKCSAGYGRGCLLRFLGSDP